MVNDKNSLFPLIIQRIGKLYFCNRQELSYDKT
jgi:hypothetical protein